MYVKFLTVLALVSFMFPAALLALDVGDEAPPLEVKEWVRGGPVKLAHGRGNKVYVVEFWATWCPPCRQSIPHLSELQAEYGDRGLIVVGISDEAADVVKKFIAGQPDMRYNVAVDDDGKTNKAYMAGRQGIPCAFVIGKDGKVLWVGHPLGMNDVLKQVFSGSFDTKKQKELSELRKQLEEVAGRGDVEGARSVSRKILDIDPKDSMALQILILACMKEKKPENAVAILDDLIKKTPDYPSYYLLRMQVIKGSGKKFGEKDFAACIDDIIRVFGKSEPMVLVGAGDMLFGEKFSVSVPLAQTMKLAEAAVRALSASKDNKKLAAALNFQARCYYSVGLLEKAVEAEKKALETAGGKSAVKLSYERNLNFYREALQLNKKMH